MTRAKKAILNNIVANLALEVAVMHEEMEIKRKRLISTEQFLAKAIRIAKKADEQGLDDEDVEEKMAVAELKETVVLLKECRALPDISPKAYEYLKVQGLL